MGGTSFFTTNGDVTAKKIVESIGYLVPDAHMLLMTAVADHNLARFLLRWIDKGFIRDMGWIALSAGAVGDVTKTLGLRSEVCFATATISSEMLAMWNDAGDVLVLSGPLLAKGDTSLPHVCFYSAWVARHSQTAVTTLRLRQATETILPILRLRGNNKNATILRTSWPG